MLNRYIDQVIEGLIDIYELERQRWDRRSDTARAAQLRAVLQTDNLDGAAAEEMLGISLRGWHRAAIAWVDAGVPDPERHLRTAVQLLRDTAGREPLTMFADDHTLWAWLTSTGRPSADDDTLRKKLAGNPVVHLAFGEAASGLNGFRSSHREAVRARTVAETALGAPSHLVEFSEVAIAALLSDNLDDLQVWVTRTLGDLARNDDDTGVPAVREQLHRRRRTAAPAQEHGALPGPQGGGDTRPPAVRGSVGDRGRTAGMRPVGPPDPGLRAILDSPVHKGGNVVP
jgi:hypothetical protein